MVCKIFLKKIASNFHKCSQKLCQLASKKVPKVPFFQLRGNTAAALEQNSVSVLMFIS